MYIDYTPEQHAWRKELRAYFTGMMTDALRVELLETEGGGPLYHAAMQQMGRDGLLGLGWDGLPADRETRIARYWAGHAGHHIVSGATHLHGGMGFDRDYALHRYYLRTKRQEFSLRAAGAQLEDLGRWIVEHGTTQRR